MLMSSAVMVVVLLPCSRLSRNNQWNGARVRRVRQVPLDQSGVVVMKIYCEFYTSKFSFSLPAAGCVPHTTHLSIPRWEGLYRSRQAHFVRYRPPKRGAYDLDASPHAQLVSQCVHMWH